MKPNEPRTIERRIGDYAATLVAIQQVIGEAGFAGWVGTIGRWLKELERPLSNEELCEHVHRAWFATGGMGSLGDITFPDARRDQRYRTLIASLFSKAERLSKALGCPALSRKRSPQTG